MKTLFGLAAALVQRADALEIQLLQARTVEKQHLIDELEWIGPTDQFAELMDWIDGRGLAKRATTLAKQRS